MQMLRGLSSKVVKPQCNVIGAPNCTLRSGGASALEGGLHAKSKACCPTCLVPTKFVLIVLCWQSL